jgi:DNA repair photolyase
MPFRLVEDLKPHPLNKRIYGDTADDDLIAGIRQLGILTPLLVTADNVVISGHRRLDAARKLGLARVPVVISPLTDKLEIELALVSANEQRQRTVEQKIREYRHLAQIAAIQAKTRQREAGVHGSTGGRGRRKKTLGEELPQGFRGRSKAAVAKPFLLSYKTLDKGVEVIDRVDALKKAGKPDDAIALCKLLETRSIHAAYNVVTGVEPHRQRKEKGVDAPAQIEPVTDNDAQDAPKTDKNSAATWANFEPIEALALLVRQLVGARACFRGDKKDIKHRKDLVAMEAVTAALEPLGAELRRRRQIDVPGAAVPVYGIELGDGLRRSAEFEKKGLARWGMNIGLACSHQCQYCSTPAMNRTSLAQLDLGRDNLGYAVVDPLTLQRLARDLPGGLTADDVVMVCTTVDAWAHEGRHFDFGRKCVMAIMEKSLAQVRILTKNAALSDDLEAFLPYRDRIMVGLSIGIPPSREDVAKIIEPHASPIHERLEVLAKAHKLGFRTYGMLCPCLPGIADTKDTLKELFDAVLACGVEDIWLEPINDRRGSIKLCAEALATAGMKNEAATVVATTESEAWSTYVLGLIQTAQRVARKRRVLDRLHVLLYPKRLAPSDRAQLEAHAEGIIWLE